MSDVNLQTNAGKPTKANNKVLWAIVLMCALPYVLGTIYYQFRDQLPMPQTSNKGDLISPVRAVGEMEMLDLQGNTFTMAAFRGQWLFVTVGSSQCLAQCQKNLYHIRQVRQAMGNDRQRVARLFILTDTENMTEFQRLLTGYEGMKVAQGPTAAIQQWENLLKNPNPVASDGIYIIDPLGNIMMSYPIGFDAGLIIKDLRRLLEVSQIG